MLFCVCLKYERNIYWNIEIYPNINLPFYKAERSSIYVIFIHCTIILSSRNFFLSWNTVILMVFSNKTLYYNASSLLEFYVSSGIHGGITSSEKSLYRDKIEVHEFCFSFETKYRLTRIFSARKKGENFGDRLQYKILFAMFNNASCCLLFRNLNRSRERDTHVSGQVTCNN